MPTETFSPNLTYIKHNLNLISVQLLLRETSNTIFILSLFISFCKNDGVVQLWTGNNDSDILTDLNPGRRFYSSPEVINGCRRFIGWVDPPNVQLFCVNHTWAIEELKPT
ncbi:hypothetical protein HanLR1_Chr01g0025321 [Helianthus annuus]|nr:hypothetical protein HanHA89_Chr01g0026731 [Helianthus annuus]KAJ0783826.1 hypothetical protein HanLR1_Chr01g0025321 [Helianthus annuus]